MKARPPLSSHRLATAAFICAVTLSGAPALGAEARFRLEVTPQRALIDEPVTILVRGAPPNTHLTLRVRAKDDLAQAWESHAEFLSDSRGRVNVTKEAPLSGTYQGIDPAGLFWSMLPLPGHQPPSPFAFGIKPIEYDLTAEADGKPSATATFERFFVAPGVKRIPVHDQGLRGTLFLPAAKKPRPGLIVVGGSGGGLNETDAAVLASKGYVALALAYFSYEDLPKTLENIPLEYFEIAVNWLNSRNEVRRGQIGIVGGSRGGELALLLGSKFRQVKAVVAFVPSGVIWPGLGNDADGLERPAWTYQGHALPFISVQNITPDQQDRIKKAFEAVPFSSAAMLQILFEDRTALANATIPVEQINGPVLLVSGKDDGVWPSTMLANMAMKRLDEAKHPFPDRHLAYDEAGHHILLPNLPTTVNTLVHPITKTEIHFGGDAAHTAAAAQDAWPRVLDFLHSALGK